MASTPGDDQLRLVVYPLIKVLYIPGGAGFLNHQQFAPEKRRLEDDPFLLGCP